MNRSTNCMNRLRRFYSVKTPFQLVSPLKALVPETPYKSKIISPKAPPKVNIDGETIALLERLSLVDCANKKGIETLEAAIEFADKIHQVDTTGVEPLITVLEDFPLRLRDDQINDGDCKEEILKNACVTEEGYFVAPPGNIPLKSREDLLFENESNSVKN
ncbi:hypothetical protein HUJ04_007710 [Dendroctonus ponderosae]|nr:hypothetical protein HUJ04_007710 [Dendroctonus ponderosae]